MKQALLSLAFLTYSIISVAQTNPNKTPSDNQLKTGLDSLVDQTVSTFMNNSARVGLSIGIIKDGKPYLYNYGSTTRDKQELPTSNTIYELASITKTFGSTLLAKAVVDKKIDLKDDIRKYLKEEYPNFNYNGTPITVVNLANLTSGLPNWMPDKDLFSKAKSRLNPLYIGFGSSKIQQTRFLQRSSSSDIKGSTWYDGTSLQYRRTTIGTHDGNSLSKPF